MRNNIKLLACLAITAVVTSCSTSLLDLKTPNSMTTATAFSTEADIDASLTGVYHSFYNSYYAMMQSNQFSGQSDEMTSYSTADLQQYIKHVYSNIAQLWNNTTWNQLYEQISRCNQVIKYAEDITEWKTFDKAQIVAQAKAVRAYAYYQLAMLYQIAPYVDYVAASDDQPAQSTFDQLCENIIKDAKEAYEVLPGSYQEKDGFKGTGSWKNQYRVTKWFACAVIAKTYMNWGDYTKGGYKYAEALPYYKDLVENGGFSLQEDYTNNFRKTTENNSESIFEIQNEVSSNGGNNYYGRANNSATPSQSTWRWKFYSAGPLGWTDYNAENWILAAFKNEKAKVQTNDSEYDERIPATIFYSEIFNDFPQHVQWKTWSATAGKTSANAPISTDTPGFSFADWTSAKTYINKYTGQYDDQAQVNTENSEGTNTRLFRLGELMIDYAECLAQTGDLAGGVEMLNQVRRRAGLCDLGERQDYKIESIYTNPETKDAVTDFNAEYGYAAFENNAAGDLASFMKVLDIESMKESALEHERFVDLRRWGIAYDADFLARVKKRSYKYYQNFTPVRAWLPMPPADVNNNPNLSQLQGW